MYHNNKPNLHDIVFVQLTSQKSDGGNYVTLIEYDKCEGLVLCTEIAKYKSNLKSLVKPNEIFPVIVISTSNGYDLSYSKIKNTSRELLKECYEFQNKIYTLINTICNKLNIDDEHKKNLIKYNLSPYIYEQSVINNNNMCKELYQNILQNCDILFNKFIINDNIKLSFKSQLQTQLEIKPYNIQKEFKLLVFDNNSFKTLKDILNNIKNITIDNTYNYEVNCRSSPYYYYKLTHNNLTDIENKIKEIDTNIINISNEFICECIINKDYNIIKKGEIICNM